MLNEPPSGLGDGRQCQRGGGGYTIVEALCSKAMPGWPFGQMVSEGGP